MSRLNAAGLVAFDAGQIESTRELPTRIIVGPWGSHQTTKGEIVINETTVRELPKNQKAANFDRIALDFNHNTVPGSESYKGEPAKVAAHATPSVEPGVGIIYSNLDWTPEGQDAVLGGHYIDLSPTLQLNSKGEAVFIHSAGLCRQGAIVGLSLFNADPAVLAETAETAKCRALLRAILSLPETANDEQVVESATLLQGRISSVADTLFSRALSTLSASGPIGQPELRLLAAVLSHAPALEERAIFSRMGLTPQQVARFT